MARNPNNPNARCRPDQLFGEWSIVGQRFAQLVELARGANLEALNAQAAKAAAEDPNGRQLYALSSDGIAVIEINGPMTKYETSFQSLFGGTSTVRVRHALRTAARDPEVRAAMLIVDSPGGTVAGTSELAAEVRAFAAKKLIHAHVDDLAASAAYWGASGAARITANPGSSIGSIGAFATLYDTSGAYKREDVKVLVVSSAPPIKGAFVDGTEITDEQLAEAKRQIEDIAALMVAEISEGRGMSVEEMTELATGQVWIASKAKELGLIDEVLTLDESMAQLRRTTMGTQTPKTTATKTPAAETPKDTPTAAQPPAPPESTVETPPAAATQPAPAEPAATESVTISATELKALQNAAAQTTKLVKADRERTFKALAKELNLADAMVGHLDTLEASVPKETFDAIVSGFKAKNAQIGAKGAGVFTERGTSSADSGEQLDAASLNRLADQRVSEGKATNRTSAIRQIMAEGRTSAGVNR